MLGLKQLIKFSLDEQRTSELFQYAGVHRAFQHVHGSQEPCRVGQMQDE